MKKQLRIICFLLSLSLLLQVAACGKKNNNDKENSNNTDDTSVEIENFEDFTIEDYTEDSTDDAKITKIKYTINGTPRVYLTTVNTEVKFRQQEADYVKVYDKSKLDKNSGTLIEVDANRLYQEIDGFGASLTESSCVNIMKLSKAKRDELMTNLFDPEKGIGLSFLRQQVGSSDFCLEYYSYDDMPKGKEDWELKNFSIEHDRKQIIPLIKQAMGLNKNMKVIAAVWSPPTWMKTQDEWRSIDNKTNEYNTLRMECYDVFSKYLIKYLEAYKEEGIDIYALSPGNEPSAWTQYPGTRYDEDQMMRLVKYNLSPLLKASGLKTKLICFDDSWNLERSQNFLGKQFGDVDFLAYHFYGGDASVMGEVHKNFPETKMWLTEAAGQQQSPQQQMFRQIKNMTEGFRNYVSAWMLWNITLDENYGPLKNGEVINAVKGTGLTEYNSVTGNISYQMDFYALAHFSKFMHPGASVIYSTDTSVASSEAYYNVSALNKNGTVTSVIGNQSLEDEVFKIAFADKVVELKVPAESVVTITWDANSK